PPGEPGYSVDDLADDAIAILDAHEIARAHIIGMSLGGFLAQLLALKYPQRVATLTLIASEPLSAGDGEVPAIDQKIIDHHMQAADLDWSDRKAVVDFITGAWRLTAGRAHAFDETGIRQLAEQDFE